MYMYFYSTGTLVNQVNSILELGSRERKKMLLKHWNLAQFQTLEYKLTESLVAGSETLHFMEEIGYQAKLLTWPKQN